MTEYLQAYCDFVYSKSMKYGENLMPSDIVDIIEKTKEYKKRIFSSKDFCDVLVNVYKWCGFELPEDTFPNEYFSPSIFENTELKEEQDGNN